MKTYEALQTCVHGHVTAVAKAVRKSTITVYKWTESHEDYSVDSGNHNPLDTVEEIIFASLNDGQEKTKAFAPIFYLCYRFNLACFEIPHTTASIKSIHQELIKSIKDFGKLCETVGSAIEDGSISRYELSAIEKEGINVIKQITTLLKKIENEVKK